MKMVVQQAEAHNANLPPLLFTIQPTHGNSVHPCDKLLSICKKQVGREAPATPVEEELIV